MNLVLEDVEEMHVKVIIYNFTVNWEVPRMGLYNRPFFMIICFFSELTTSYSDSL